MIWLILCTLALAEPPEGDRKVIYKKKTEIDFEGIELEGQLVKPQGSLITERQGAAFNPLIKLRTDFKQEMNLSVEEIK
tara:strand:- start:37 stop:273 length:237 start_codon:yes stop_codon:yes gene_type:complete